MALFIVKLIFSLMILYQCSTADDIKDESEVGAGDANALWFGPRLGKRSLKLSNEDNRQSFLRLLEAADTLKYYYDQLPYYTKADDPETRVTKKVIFTPKLGRNLKSAYPEKRMDVEFTPRLGRRLSLPPELSTPEQEMDSVFISYKSELDPVKRTSDYFMPRLGRTVNFSPRLGRELTDNYPENIRLARSTNDTKTA